MTGSAWPSTYPLLSESTYPGTRKRPWLRAPSRSARATVSARMCATVADVPFFSKIEASSIFKSSNAMVLLSVSLPGFAVIRYPRLRCLVDAVLRSSSNARRFPAIRPSLHADPGMDGYRPGVQGTLP
ncbi:Uncharacterised protein [Bordetella pertussis]|nr:Uncharacterised protein [Bordetella pertussis]